MHFQSNKAIQCKTLEANIYHFHLGSPKNGWQIWNQEPKMQGRRVTAAAKSKNFPFSTNSSIYLGSWTHPCMSLKSLGWCGGVE